MTSNTVMLIAYGIAALGIAVLFGIFEVLGPINTPRRMKWLGIGILVLAFLLMLTQSTSTGG